MIDGLVIVDKPAGWTSHDVVGRCRRVFGQRRVGHAGTLDPDATGVLLVGLGRATRLLRFLAGHDKDYRCEIVLGVATSTLDAVGQVTARADLSAVGLDQARRAARTLTGWIDQVPPMVSAVSVGGRRLHQLAREGIEIERPSRRVLVERFDIADMVGPAVDGVGPVLAVEVTCSAGTYVRVLAADLGEALGGCAHLRALRRTRSGPFGVDQARSLDEIGPADVRPPASAVAHLAPARIGPDLAGAVAHGAVLDPASLGGGQGPWAVLDEQDRLLAVYEAAGTRAKPAVVLAAAGAGHGEG